jgi:hypothetical protein
MRCIALKICLVLQQNPTSNFGTTYFFFFPKRTKSATLTFGKGCAFHFYKNKNKNYKNISHTKSIAALV